ncbi:hypothetical protein BN2475_220020 [Paraburkholderia ribeironis]|uniref:Uncharacterized protein n=1 Tax=Paraburkholderia ribeironis TaxID=1247936 RepID=A0A1N7RX25_9BURK|nr:hypothetical protein BN2475_220020 [Paraburkholderia ribeironis]
MAVVEGCRRRLTHACAQPHRIWVAQCDSQSDSRGPGFRVRKHRKAATVASAGSAIDDARALAR